MNIYWIRWKTRLKLDILEPDTCRSSFFLCVVLLRVSTFRFPCCDVRDDFPYKNYVRFVFFSNSGINHILCCVFVLFFLRFVDPIFPISLIAFFHYLFWNAPSVFSNLYLIDICNLYCMHTTLINVHTCKHMHATCTHEWLSGLSVLQI